VPRQCSLNAGSFGGITASSGGVISVIVDIRRRVDWGECRKRWFVREGGRNIEKKCCFMLTVRRSARDAARL
jgi:hypothetical protein